MTNPLDWEDIVWKDPEGGEIRLYGTIPTVITPNSLRPRYEFDAVAFIESSDIISYWDDLTHLEKESPGISLEAVKFGATSWSKFIKDLLQLEDVSGGRFPDPEPLRILKMAERNGMPVYFLEPEIEDEEWAELLVETSKELARPKQLLKAVFTSRRWNRLLKKNIRIARPPPKGHSTDYSTASVLTATWWHMEESTISKSLAEKRDKRVVSRLKGSMDDLRGIGINNPVLLLPMVQSRRKNILDLLNKINSKEECSFYKSASDSTEEE